ncbi:MAG: 2-oxo acid dehydrogenase subunit E2 [Spirochaetota bacterium]
MRTPDHLFTVKETIPFDIQRRVVAHMTGSAWRQIPHVAAVHEPDVTELMAEFTRQRETVAADGGLKITFTMLMLKIIAEALAAAPELNAHISYDARRDTGELRIMESVNISLPWLLPDGRMITPVLRNIETMLISDIADAMKEIENKIKNTDINEMLYQAAVHDTLYDLARLRLRAVVKILHASFGKNRIVRMDRRSRRKYYEIPESRRLTPDDIASGTVLVSNTGSAYPQGRSVITLLEIIPPQVFVLALNAVQTKAAVFKDRNGEEKIGIRKILPISMAFDHRAADFAALIPFQKRIDEICANPELIRGWF